jgi:hypothetical protein
MSEINAIATNNYILQAPPPTATMFTTELEYDGDKISGYAGSAFKAGTDLEFGYDSADNISAINNSALTDVSLNNIVQTNSGAWGGSALPISAGPGIKVNLVDNTLVFSNDETVLWEAPTTAGATACTLSESYTNFKNIKIGYYTLNDRVTFVREILPQYQRADKIDFETYTYDAGSMYWKEGQYTFTTDTQLDASTGIWYYTNNNQLITATGNEIVILGITGINRK